MTFEQWAQMRLNAHGAKLAVDGDWGVSSRDALKSFQIAKGLRPTGVIDDETTAALKSAPAVADVDLSAPAPDQTMPPWMAEMHRRLGLHEKRDNRALSKWLASAGKFLGNPARLPWCGDAVETCILKALPNEKVPSNPFWAQGWKNFGVDAGGPIVGAIGVIRWSSKAGHVGIVVGYDARSGRVHMMGGNQSDSISISSFPQSKFIAFRWPGSYRIGRYPALAGLSMRLASVEATR